MRYLSAKSRGEVKADRRNAGKGERFFMQTSNNSKVMFRTRYGTFLGVDSSKKIVAMETVAPNETLELDRRNLNPLECCCGRGDLSVVITNLKGGSGHNLRVMIFETEASWKSDTKYRGGRAVAMKTLPFKSNWTQTGQTESIEFNGLLYHYYAVMAHHDEDKDGKLDTNFIGMPQEGVCATNGATGGPFGGPKWKIAKFNFSENGHKESLEMWYP